MEIKVGVELMTLLNDEEKVAFLIELLERHMSKFPAESNLANYLESIRGFLKTKDPILQKAECSNSELFIDSISHDDDNQITSKHAVGSLIATFDKIKYADSLDAAAIILEFEDNLKQIAKEEAENIYLERWMTDKFQE